MAYHEYVSNLASGATTGSDREFGQVGLQSYNDYSQQHQGQYHSSQDPAGSSKYQPVAYVSNLASGATTGSDREFGQVGPQSHNDYSQHQGLYNPFQDPAGSGSFNYQPMANHEYSPYPSRVLKSSYPMHPAESGTEPQNNDLWQQPGHSSFVRGQTGQIIHAPVHGLQQSSYSNQPVTDPASSAESSFPLQSAGTDRRHAARASTSIPSSSHASVDTPKVKKPKKKRTNGTLSQRAALEKSLALQAYPTPDEKNFLAGQIGMKPKAVTKWFQNHRKDVKDPSLPNQTYKKPSDKRIDVLSDFYKTNKFPNPEEREELATSSGMTKGSVQTWFWRERKKERFRTAQLVPIRGTGAEQSSATSSHPSTTARNPFASKQR